MCKRRRSWRLLAAAMAVAGGAAGPACAAPPESVSLITDFGFNGRHAYFFVALDKGYYKENGLEVKILRGQGSVDAIRQTGAGNATFGFAEAGSLVLARANDGIPDKLVAIVYQRPPQAIYCRADSGIKEPKDLEGRSIANPAGGSIPDLFPVYAKAAGVDAAKVRWVVASSESLSALLAANRVPCVGQFVVGEPMLRIQAAPEKLVRFAYADAGLKYYGNGIVATDTTIAAKPDLVRRFVAATVKGMQDAFADPTAAGEIMHKYHPEVSVEIAKGETEAVAELARVPGAPLGGLTQAGIDATLDVIKGAFSLKHPVSAADLYAPGFVPQ